MAEKPQAPAPKNPAAGAGAPAGDEKTPTLPHSATGQVAGGPKQVENKIGWGSFKDTGNTESLEAQELQALKAKQKAAIEAQEKGESARLLTAQEQKRMAQLEAWEAEKEAKAKAKKETKTAKNKDSGDWLADKIKSSEDMANKTKDKAKDLANSLPRFGYSKFIWPAVLVPEAFPGDSEQGDATTAQSRSTQTQTANQTGANQQQPAVSDDQEPSYQEKVLPGRLPASIQEILDNRCTPAPEKDEEGKTQKPCQKELKISLFFDGTNNHEEADKAVSGFAEPEKNADFLRAKPRDQAKEIKPYTYPRTTNVARLYHACMGQENTIGYVTDRDSEIDLTKEKGWFKYYIQGVGTRFAEIGDEDPGMLGEAFAKFGQARVNWGLTRICDALGLSGHFQERRLENEEAGQMVATMTAQAGRQKALDDFFDALVLKPQGPLPKGIKLYVIGFSRGAAEARTFTNWLLRYLLERPENAEVKAKLAEQAQQKETKKADKATEQAKEGQAKEGQAKENAKTDSQEPQKADQNKATSTAANTGLVNSGANTQSVAKIAATAAQLQGQNKQNPPAKTKQDPKADQKTDQKTEKEPALQLKLRGIPIHIEMMGLFDTVATVGMSPVLPFNAGHLSWANKTMSLEDAANADFIKNCYHFVSAQEQRKSFSVDSICINGRYPKGNFKEYIYPGVHSDVGGGYPPGEQFKANKGMGHVFSQIALHDMYALCWQHGMPLQVWTEHPQLAAELKKNSKFKLTEKEVMITETAKEFDIRPETINRFNAWRTTVNSSNINIALKQQVHHITAWRILRWLSEGDYGPDGYAHRLGLSIRNGESSTKYKEGKDQVKAREEIINVSRAKKNAEYNAGKDNGRAISPEKQEELTAKHDALMTNDAHWKAADLDKLPPEKRQELSEALLNKNYVQSNDAWDLMEGAKEFRADYYGEFRLQDFLSVGGFLNTVMGGSILMMNNVDEAEEFKDIHTEGSTLYGVTVPQEGGSQGGSAGGSAGEGKTAEGGGAPEAQKPVPAGNIPAPAGATPGIVPTAVAQGQTGQTGEAEKKAGEAASTEGGTTQQKKEDISTLFRKADKSALLIGTLLDVLKSNTNDNKKGVDLIKVGLDKALERLSNQYQAQMNGLQVNIKKQKEQYSKQHPEMVQLFDEQVHDSRAWFMHDSFLGSREPFTNYFAHRTVYSGTRSNKPLSPLMIADQIVGVAGVVRSAYMSVRYRNPAYLLMGLHNPKLFIGDKTIQSLYTAAGDYGRIILDDNGRITGETANANALWAFTEDLKNVYDEVDKDFRKTPDWTSKEIRDNTIDKVIKPKLDKELSELSEVIEMLKERRKEARAKAKESAPIGEDEQGALDQLDKTIDDLEDIKEATEKVAKELPELPEVPEVPEVPKLAEQDPDLIERVQDLTERVEDLAGEVAVLKNNQATQVLPDGSRMQLPQNILDGTQDGIIFPSQVQNLQMEDITPQSMADALQKELNMYKQKLAANSQATTSLMRQGTTDPAQLADVFYNDASGDIANQVTENITQKTLNYLNSDIEINEYLLENLAQQNQSDIIALAKHLKSGNIPPELRSLSPNKLRSLQQALKKWII